MRIFEGARNLGPLHFYPNVFDARPGQNIIELHAHEKPHVTLLGAGPWRVILDEVTHETVVADNDFELVLVPAGVRHAIQFLGTGMAKACCIFSRYDETGAFLPEPKAGEG